MNLSVYLNQQLVSKISLIAQKEQRSKNAIRLLSKLRLEADFSVKTFLAIRMYPHTLRLLGRFFLKILTPI